MKLISGEEIRQAYWKGRDEADSPVDEGAGWASIAQAQLEACQEACEKEEEAEMVGRLLDRGWIPPEKAQEKVREIFEEIESHAGEVLLSSGLFQVVLTSEEWQALKKKGGVG